MMQQAVKKVQHSGAKKGRDQSAGDFLFPVVKAEEAK